METNLLSRFITAVPAEALIASIWQGFLLTGFAWAALKLAPRLNLGLRASTRFTLWLVAFLLVALLPFIAMPATSPLATGPLTDRSLHVNVAWAFVLEALWAIASLLSLARLAIAGVHMRKLLRSSTPVSFADLDPDMQAIVARPGARPIEIRLCDALDTPSVVGFLRPAVLLPSTLCRELEPGDLKQILMHEKAHLDRGDDWTNLLQKLLRALCPLNPALFWAERNLCLQREQACDDAVLDAAGNPRAYATCLTRLAENRLVKRVAALAPGMWKRPSELAGRVENILYRKTMPRPIFAQAFLAACLFTSLLGAVLLQRCPHWISFAAGETATPAALTMEPHPRYQQASFHPTPKQVSIKPHPVRKIKRAPRLRILALRSIDARGAMTLVVFTVDTPNSWIIFQI